MSVLQEVSFLDTPIGPNGLFIVNLIVDALFATDICINLTLATVSPSGAVITDQRTVAYNYLRGSAAVDVVSTLPWDLVFSDTGGGGLQNVKILRILRIIRLFKLLRIMRSSKVLARTMEIWNISNGMAELLKYFMAVFVVAHWLACLLHLVVHSQQTNCNWVNQYFGARRCQLHCISREACATA